MNKISSCIINNNHLDSFDVLSADEKKLLDKHKIEVVYRKGETIIKQGSLMSNVIFLNYGLVKTYMEGEKKDLILKIVPSNHFIGLSSFFENNNTFIHSTSAFIDSKVTLIDKDIFSQIIHSNSKFAFKIISILNSNTAQVYGRFYCLTCKQAHGKVADLLLCLADRVFKEDIFNLPISRSDFAELLGISMESVIRIFKQLKDEKLISIKGSTFNIINKDALNKISNFG